ncbi:MAG: ABC transporter ATP-binding protein [Anaerolineae bacterium]
MSQTRAQTARAESRPAPRHRRGPGAHLLGPAERAQNVGGTLLRIWGYLRRQTWALVATFFLVTASSGLGLLGPYLLGVAIDQNILKGDLPGLARTAGLMVGANLLAAVTGWLDAYVMAGASQRAVRDMRNDLFGNLQLLSLRYLDQHTHGEMMSRLANDVEMVSQVLTMSVSQLFSSVISIVGVAIMMFIINVRLALVTLVTLPLMMFISRWIAKHTRRGYQERQEALGDLNGIIEETVTGQRVVKAYAREEAAIAQFGETNQRMRRVSTRAEILVGTMGPLTNLVNNIGFALVAGAGGWMAVLGLATVGAIASFINYARQFARPLNQITGLYNTIQSAIAGAERVFEVMDEVPELQDAPDAHSLTRVQGDVVFDDVSFAYKEDVPVLKHVSLRAEPGQTIALVGPTGAGKTTIVNLLTRFYDIDSGSIRIDGIDIRQVRKDDLRRQLGIVLQDTYLFADTVMENIRYGRLDATDEEVIAAAKLANAHVFIHRLPQGYQTPLSERGSNLSLGQRQLLAIARAVLADPGILVLDEATSSVDTRTEKQIQEAMLRLMEGRTSFVIAHRLSTIREADKILVINDGEIIERGTHEQLLAARGFYQHLYVSQFKGQHELVPELAAD